MSECIDAASIGWIGKSRPVSIMLQDYVSEMSNEAEIRAGLFADFYDPTILFWGSSGGLSRFSKLLRSIRSGPNASFLLTGEPGIRAVKDTAILLEIEDRGRGIHRLSGDGSNTFCWSLYRVQAGHFADAIDVLVNAEHPCHQYLDASAAEAYVVMVSKDEYTCEDEPISVEKIASDSDN